MSEELWSQLTPLADDTLSPNKLVSKLFSGIEGYTGGKVKFVLEKANFFPEEVTSSFSLNNAKAWKEHLVGKEAPHPDFGYNPELSRKKEYFRYRLLLFPAEQRGVEFELVKFKYPISCYPVKFYCDKESFELLSEDFDKSGQISARNETELTDYITKIIKSKSTLELISKLAALSD